MNLDKANDSDTSSPHSDWLKEADWEIMKDHNRFSIPRLQVLLLLMFDDFAKGDLGAVAFRVALAARLVFGLKLNYPTEAVPFTNQECRRRHSWCTYLLDKLVAGGGLPYPSICPRGSIHVQVPCDSRSFQLEYECVNPTLDEFALNPATYKNFSSIGVTSYLVRILDLYDQIQAYLKSRNDAGLVGEEVEPDPAFRRFEEELRDFGENLPPDMQDDERAVYTRVNTPESDVYIMVQTWWRTCWCELLGPGLRSIVDNSSDPSRVSQQSFVGACASSVKQHAAALNRFWRAMATMSKSARTFLVTDWSFAPCVLKNTQALIRGRQLPPDPGDRDKASFEAALAFNLEILEPLAAICPSVASWVCCYESFLRAY